MAKKEGFFSRLFNKIEDEIIINKEQSVSLVKQPEVNKVMRSLQEISVAIEKNELDRARNDELIQLLSHDSSTLRKIRERRLYNFSDEQLLDMQEDFRQHTGVYDEYGYKKFEDKMKYLLERSNTIRKESMSLRDEYHQVHRNIDREEHNKEVVKNIRRGDGYER